MNISMIQKYFLQEKKREKNRAVVHEDPLTSITRDGIILYLLFPSMNHVGGPSAHPTTTISAQLNV